MKKTLLGQFAETLNNPESEISAYSFVAEHYWEMDKDQLKAIALEALYLLKQQQEAEMLENLASYYEDEMTEED